MRLSGNWETLLEFFGDAIVASATPATTSAKRLRDLASSDGRRIEGLGRAAASALAIHRALQRQLIATAASRVTTTGLTAATVNKSLAHLERLRIVAELTRKLRGRVFGCARYADILNEGMELPRTG